MDSTFTPLHRGGAGAPLVCLHGFTDTWRTWELVLPALERRHDVLALTLAGHAGGPPLAVPPTQATLADAVERAMDDAGFATAHLVGNSLGGYVALQLAARGRARSVVAFSPAGGWARDDPAAAATLSQFTALAEQLPAVLPHVDALVATPDGRRNVTRLYSERGDQLSPELVAHLIRGAAGCAAVEPLVELALREGWSVDAERIDCPVRIAWGTDDRLLTWPSSAVRFREQWLPHADWVELDGVGHCPQLDVPRETAELITGFAGFSG